MSRRKNSSSMWHHFLKKDYGKAKCIYCKEIFSYVSTTTNLKSHLMRRHIDAYTQLALKDETVNTTLHESKQEPKQDTSTEIHIKAEPVSPKRPSSTDLNTITPEPKLKKTDETSSQIYNPKSKQIDYDVLDMIIDGFHSFSLVEETPFRKLMRRIPYYKLPDSETVSKLIRELYVKTHTCVKEQIAKEVASICITTEAWVSKLNENFVGVTGHYITSDLESKTVFLGCCQLNDLPIPKTIAKEIKGLITKYNLQTKVNFIVSGNDAKLTTAIQDFLEWNRLRCFIDTLSSVVEGAMKFFKDDIEQVKKLVVYFKRELDSPEKLTKEEEALSKELVMPIDKNWIATYHMLNSFVDLKKLVQMAYLQNWPAFEPQKWTTFAQVCQVLKAFEEMTIVMKNEKYVSASWVIVITRCLKGSCKKMLAKKNMTPSALSFIKTLEDGLDKHFGDVEQIEALALCTFMDPRFKMQAFADINCATKTKETIIKLLTVLIEQSIQNDEHVEDVRPAQAQEENEEFSALTILDEIVGQSSTRKTPLARAITEINMFLADGILPRKDKDGQWNCPLKWWKQNQYVYPNLAKVFMEECNIVVTSIPRERFFSETGRVISERRSMLTGDTVEKLAFLNVNLPEDRFKT